MNEPSSFTPSTRMADWLESKDFYELCQSYRHAGDVVAAHPDLPTAAEAFERLKLAIMDQSFPVSEKKAIPEIAAVVTSEGMDHRAQIERYTDCPVGTHLYKAPMPPIGGRVWSVHKDYGQEGEVLCGLFSSREDAEEAAVVIRNTTMAKEVHVDEWTLGEFEA